MPPIVRFAPSPTGKLHVGNVRAALWNWLFAKRHGGSFILRIDDTDQARSTPEFEQGIKDDLNWLGLKWDDTFNQSACFDAYAAAADKLREEGLLYPCYETPEEIDRKRKLQRARGAPPVYDRAALDLGDDDRKALEDDGRRPHWRFKLSQTPVTWRDLIRGETSVDTASVSDPVLIREDGQYLYTLPSCVDDIARAVTHVIRGEDHVTNTAVQIELIAALGGEAPEFAHHSLLVDADGEGLSKRLGSLAIEGLREDGVEAAAITSLLARLGTNETVEPISDLAVLAQAFSFDRVGRAPARFDDSELRALNARVLHEAPFEQYADRLAPLGVTERLWNAVRKNIETLADVSQWREIIEGEIDPVIEDEAFTQAAATLVPEGDYTDDTWSEFVAAVKDKTGAKGKALFMPLRLALTGRRHGPEMGPLFALLGPEKVAARLSGQRA
ncbi:MAG: glutamate--tRNA ligase [Pseudomonadota bacterium]